MSNYFVTFWTTACQAPLSMGFLSQEYWSGLPFPSPGDFPHLGIKPASSKLTEGFFTTEPPRKPFILTHCEKVIFIVVMLQNSWAVKCLEGNKEVNTNCIYFLYWLAHIFYFVSALSLSLYVFLITPESMY